MLHCFMMSVCSIFSSAELNVVEFYRKLLIILETFLNGIILE